MLVRLVTGCGWQDAERLCGNKVSDTTVRSRRDEWQRAGIFDRLADRAIEGYDRIIGLDFSEVSLDACQGPWGSPRGRSWNLPAGGRQFFPVAASGSPRVRGAYRSPLSVSSAAATGSSQQGQVPPRPAARMNRLHSGHLCSPSVRRSQSSQT
jgi:hypothetical protein